jgi:hypothetical protein
MATLQIGNGNWAVEEDFLLGYNINDYNGKYYPRDIAWTRGSDAWRTTSSGLIQRTPWNLFTQSIWSGGGALPTGWNYSFNSGTSAPVTSIYGIGSAYSFTTSSTRQVFNQSLNYVSGNTYSLSIRVESVSGTIAVADIIFFNGGGTLTYFEDGASVSASKAVVAGKTYTTVIACNTTATQQVRVGNGCTANTTGTVVLSQPQLVEGSAALDYFPTTDRLNVGRVDYAYTTRGAMLVEPQRTNSIRNSTMVGAVVGNPGTLPTNYGEVLSGLSREIVGIGTENGVSYIDYKISGTASSTIAQLRFDGSTNIPALTGQTWSESAYLKIISGTIDSVRFAMIERTSAGSYVSEFQSNALPVSTSLSRFTFTATLSGGATTAYVQPSLYFIITNGASYNFTIRIAQPQMEFGAYATTPILTFGSATVTRIADSFTRSNIFTNGYISSAGGTWYAEFVNNIQYTRDAGNSNFFIGDTANNSPSNSLEIRNGGVANSRLDIGKRIGGTFTTLYTTTTSTVKIAIKWNGANVDVFVNGVKQVSASAFTITNMEFLYSQIQDVPRYIPWMTLYSTPLSDAECAFITTL